MIFAGVDIGSTTSKALLIDENKEVLASSLVFTRYDRNASGLEALNRALSECGKTVEALDYLVTTGYGRRAMAVSNNAVPEIMCHALGTQHSFPEYERLLISGGRTAKLLRLMPAE
jgi:activator of 2-hydroxyglutaryl-CoA dehydratase